MILNTGSRTDIPAYYSKWFYRRIEEGYVYVRSPYNPLQVTRYRLDPEVVDCVCFCTKNPEPMLPGLRKLAAFRQLWYVTITPYDREIEPGVPDKKGVLDSFRRLSEAVGREHISWRYDPVFLSEKYTLSFHQESFEQMAAYLEGYTDQCVISFIDLYAKTRRNFPEGKEVSRADQEALAKAFVESGRRHGITIRSCCEGSWPEQYGIDTGGCMSRQVMERAVGSSLRVPKKAPARPECSCLLGSDIGVYNSCGHGCLYCYANYDQETVKYNMRRHDPRSPFLIGGHMEGEVIREASQESWLDGQLELVW